MFTFGYNGYNIKLQSFIILLLILKLFFYNVTTQFLMMLQYYNFYALELLAS